MRNNDEVNNERKEEIIMYLVTADVISRQVQYKGAQCLKKIGWCVKQHSKLCDTRPGKQQYY